MTTPEWLCEKVRLVLDAELKHCEAFDQQGREDRLRMLKEIELTSRLRHEVGKLKTLMSARGADISSEDPSVEVQIKFPNYWDKAKDKPQPIGIEEIEKDLGWLAAAGDRPRYFVLFLPQCDYAYTVQGKGADVERGRRRLQHAFSARDQALERAPLAMTLLDKIGELVAHKKGDGKSSQFRRFRNAERYDGDVGVFRSYTIGSPTNDLIWALVLCKK